MKKTAYGVMFGLYENEIGTRELNQRKSDEISKVVFTRHPIHGSTAPATTPPPTPVKAKKRARPTDAATAARVEDARARASRPAWSGVILVTVRPAAPLTARDSGRC